MIIQFQPIGEEWLVNHSLNMLMNFTTDIVAGKNSLLSLCIITYIVDGLRAIQINMKNFYLPSHQPSP